MAVHFDLAAMEAEQKAQLDAYLAAARAATDDPGALAVLDAYGALIRHVDAFILEFVSLQNGGISASAIVHAAKHAVSSLAISVIGTIVSNGRHDKAADFAAFVAERMAEELEGGGDYPTSHRTFTAQHGGRA